MLWIHLVNGLSHAVMKENDNRALCGMNNTGGFVYRDDDPSADRRCSKCLRSVEWLREKADEDVKKFDKYMAHYQAVLEKKLATIPNEDVNELPMFQIAMAKVIAACNVRDYSAAEEAMKELRNIVLHRTEIRDMAERHMKERKE